MTQTAEALRLIEAKEKNIPWKKWGPYLSEISTQASLVKAHS